MKKGDKVIVTLPNGKLVGTGEVVWTDGYVAEVCMKSGRIRQEVIGKTVHPVIPVIIGE